MTESFNIGPENFEVFSDAEIVWMGAAIITPEVIYIPYATADGQVGYIVRSVDGGESEHFYLNPSTSTDDGVPNIFVYQGQDGRPGHDYDGALQHFVVAEDFESIIRFGEIELSPFRKDADDNWPENTDYLYNLTDGQLFEDSEGRVFNKVGHGPVQGSVEIVDDDQLHAYWDVTTRIRPN